MNNCESCTFFGHRDFNKLEYNKHVQDILEHLVLENNVRIFLSGGMGNFDRICEGFVRKLKKKYSDAALKLVLPYPEYSAFKIAKRDIELYDEIIIPNLKLKNIKSAIPRRNIYMVNSCKFVVSGIYKESGGAAAAVNYAVKRPGVKVINIFNETPF